MIVRLSMQALTMGTKVRRVKQHPAWRQTPDGGASG